MTVIYAYGADHWRRVSLLVKSSACGIAIMTILPLAAACGYAGAPEVIGLTLISVDSGERTVFPLGGSVVGVDGKEKSVYLLNVDAVTQCTYEPTFLRRELKTLVPPSGARGDEPGEVSPSFRKLVYFGEDYPESGIWVSNLESQEPSRRIVGAPSSYHDVACLKWLSDSSVICAVRGFDSSEGYSNQILRVDTETGNLKVFHQGRDFNLASFALTSDRQRLAFTDEAPSPGDMVVQILDVDSGKVHVLLTCKYPPLAPHLSWSPDGTRLAVTTLSGIMVVSVNTGKSTAMRDGGRHFAGLIFVKNDRLAARRSQAVRSDSYWIFDANSGNVVKRIGVNSHFSATSIPGSGTIVHGADCLYVRE